VRNTTRRLQRFGSTKYVVSRWPLVAPELDTTVSRMTTTPTNSTCQVEFNPIDYRIRHGELTYVFASA